MAWPLGKPLGIDGLAQQLDVSPTPVREALVQLESTAMVTRTALRGYRVAPLLSGRQLTDLFDARLLLEVGLPSVPRSTSMISYRSCASCWSSTSRPLPR